MTYLRDRLTAARDLLSSSGSIFVQIGDQNVHLIRSLLDEVFGTDHHVATITFKTSVGLGATYLDRVCDNILWYARDHEQLKFRSLFTLLERGERGATRYNYVELPDGSERSTTTEERDSDVAFPSGTRFFTDQGLTSRRQGTEAERYAVDFRGGTYRPSVGTWRTTNVGMRRLIIANRLMSTDRQVRFKKYFDDFGAIGLTNFWEDAGGGIQSRSDPKIYVVQTNTRVIERCLLMSTDPGDLVLDPTCGSGTTAQVAERWGRRWIVIDTSRVALALARSRLTGASYPYYYLADSLDGQLKEAEVTRTAPSETPTHGDIRQGFVYERVPHVTLKSIANNAEIDVIWERFQQKLEPLREALNQALKQTWQEWEIPREADEKWPAKTKALHAEWWQLRIARQKEIDASIAAKAEFEYLYDKPYEDKSKVRVAGPFTVESISPHRVLTVGEDDELIDRRVVRDGPGGPSSDGGDEAGFVHMILENLRTAGVQQAHKEDKINFTSLAPWPGRLICAEGRYVEGDPEDGANYREADASRSPQASGTRERAGSTPVERRAGVFIGPEFGTVSRQDLVEAAREAADANFDVLVACAFNYEAHASEFNKLGRIHVLKARMNADLHMADDLKNTGKGNLFVIFGEPDIEVLPAAGDGATAGQIQVKIKGVDVFHPNTGEVRSDGPEGIACWFIDTDYNQESFFVRHAYFLGANDPYKALKTTLKAEIDADAWATLHSDTSRPFDKPTSGRIAVKVINHLGDEVMKVFRVS
ncbi:MAG TPA: site-specific DNA-methyltransferase [Pirellulales bacterium]|nr:site-specific DNA-methyltransferase [Pirellulales bacterium]